MDNEHLKVAYEKGETGILRCEVHYTRSRIRAMEKKLGTNSPAELLWAYIERSQKDITKHLNACYPTTNYYSYDALQKFITASTFSDVNKHDMLELCTALRKIQSVNKAAKVLEFKKKHLNNCLKRFQKLGASPIPLRKNIGLKSLPSIILLLETLEDTDRVELAYQEKKYK